MRLHTEIEDILRAEAAGEDLHETDKDPDLRVCAMKSDGQLYEIGVVSLALIYQQPEAARQAIARIKFGR